MAKFYVVWVGNKTGVFSSWNECKESVVGVPGAKYKSFGTRIEAETALKAGPVISKKLVGERILPPEIKLSPSGFAIAVDGACSGSTTIGEFKGVLMPAMKELFLMGPFEHSTNNIMEFLAIVKAFRWLKIKGIRMPVFSDSRIAIGWINGTAECKTNNMPPFGSLLHTEICKAHRWLREAERLGILQEFKELLFKWDTAKYGEIPADFGRK